MNGDVIHSFTTSKIWFESRDRKPTGVTNCLYVPGPGSGWSRTGSISGYSASGRGSAGPGTGYWSGAGDRDR